MFEWFTKHAPIRLKFKLLVGIYAVIVLAVVATTYLARPGGFVTPQEMGTPNNPGVIRPEMIHCT